MTKKSIIKSYILIMKGGEDMDEQKAFAIKLRKILLQNFKIKNDEELIQAVKDSSINIAIFTRKKGGLVNV